MARKPMDKYLLSIYVTIEQEEAIRCLYTEQGWEFEKSDMVGGKYNSETLGQFTPADIALYQLYLETSKQGYMGSTVDSPSAGLDFRPPPLDDGMDLTKSPLNAQSLMKAFVDWQARSGPSATETGLQIDPRINDNAQNGIPSSTAMPLDVDDNDNVGDDYNGDTEPEDTELIASKNMKMEVLDSQPDQPNPTEDVNKGQNSGAFRMVKVEYDEDYDADTDVEDYTDLIDLTALKDTKTKKRAKKTYPKKKKKKVNPIKREIIVCDICNRTYHSRETYNQHFQKNNGKCYFECEFCDKVFYFKKSKLDVHIRSAHTKERPFKCETCGKGYVTPDKLKIHERVHTGEKPFVCDQCGKAFYSLGQLSIHRNYNHIWPQYPKSFKCEKCDAAFNSKNYLKYHLKTVHCTTRDYHCHICPKSFKAQDGLRCHLKFTHSESNTIKCSECDRTFKTPAGMRRHKMRHLSVIPKRFVCTVCEKAFAEKDKLKMHMNVHTGNKPYKCKMCDFSCAFSGNLSKHKKSHGHGSMTDRMTMNNPFLQSVDNSVDNFFSSNNPNQQLNEAMQVMAGAFQKSQ